jgi:flavin reductase (DIM6/NTAB) family NADH-FMN oxidoreductase RutF
MPYTFVADETSLNHALFRVTHGLYVLAARAGDRINAQCLDAMMQVTNAPPRVAIAIGKRSLTHEMIAGSGRFVVSVLDREDPERADLIRRFGFQSGRDADKFAGLPHDLTERGIPYLPNAVAVYECTVLSEMTLDLGTHTLFVASVDRAGTREGGDPLTYNEYRKSLRRGASKPEMEKWTCTVCGYVYDPAVGDPTSDIKPGTPFEDLPADWVCPVCGVGKEMFEKAD